MRFFLFLALFFASVTVAQTHRFVYNMQYKTDSTATDLRKATMVLDVNPDEIKFYNYQFISMDSLNKVRNSNSAMWDSSTPVLIRDRKSNQNRVYVLQNHLLFLESTDTMLWKLSPETREQDGYHLQKATTRFGGRNWTAWFTKEISLQEGPYKFRGLPGFIFEVEDDRQNYRFTLVKSYILPKTYDTRSFLENFAGMKPAKITAEKYSKLLLDRYRDPLHDFRETFSKNTNKGSTYWYNGIEVKEISQFKELTEMERQRMLKENNPIELDQAVKYPLK